jgi:hypothetical protein
MPMERTSLIGAMILQHSQRQGLWPLIFKPNRQSYDHWKNGSQQRKPDQIKPSRNASRSIQNSKPRNPKPNVSQASETNPATNW